MPESQMTLEKAIIILDQLNTTERIEVDRAKLKAAIKTVKAAAQKQLAMKPKPDNRYYGNGICPSCNAVFLDKATNCCGNCGQRLNWEVKG